MAGEPRTSGWKVIATLRHRAGRPTSVQLAHPSVHINVDAWSRSKGWCEHCRTRRARRITYLLRHDDGRLAQVGSSCLADFTVSPNHAPIRRLPKRRPAQRPPSGLPRTPAEYVETRTYLAHVAQAVLELGFTPISAETRQRPATWRQASATLDHDRVPSVRAWRRGQAALHWIREELAVNGRLDDFERRLTRVLSRDRLTRRELPTAAAGVYAYHQHLRRQIASRKATNPGAADAA